MIDDLVRDVQDQLAHGLPVDSDDMVRDWIRTQREAGEG